MIALVTGSSGFIGSHLVSRLKAEGHTVRRLTRRQSRARGVEAKGTSQVTVDFDREDLGVDPSALADAELVFHAAGVTRGIDDRTFIRANADGTRRLLSALTSAGANPRRVVLVSSQAAGGPAPSLDRPTTERYDQPIDPYGRSKLEAERHVQSFGDRLPFNIVRPAAVYGPGDRDFLTIFRMARLGLAVYPANRDSWLSIVHVADLVDAIVKASVAPVAGRTFMIANDAPVKWSDVYAAVASSMNRRTPIDVEVPSALLRLAAKAGDVATLVTGRPLLITTNKLVLGEQKYWVCSNACARQELEWAPRVSLLDGMREWYDWWVRQNRS